MPRGQGGYDQTRLPVFPSDRIPFSTLHKCCSHQTFRSTFVKPVWASLKFWIWKDWLMKCDVVDKVILDGSSLEMLKLEILLNIAMRHARSQQLAVHFPGLRRRKCLVLCFSNLLNSLAFSIVEDMHTLRCRQRDV